MFDLILNKDDSFIFEKKLATSRGVPQENDAKFRFAIHPQYVATLAPVVWLGQCRIFATTVKVNHFLNEMISIVTVE